MAKAHRCKKGTKTGPLYALINRRAAVALVDEEIDDGFDRGATVHRALQFVLYGAVFYKYFPTAPGY